MRKLILFVSLFVSMCCQAQRFETLHDLALPIFVASAQIEVADFDNDGLLDVAIIGIDNSSRSIQFIKGDTLNTPAFTASLISIDDYSSYSILDYDDDNDFDFVFFGLQSVIYLNNGSFSFTKQFISLPAFKKSVWVDLNNDGQKEIVGSFVSGSDELICVFKRTSTNSWGSVGDTLQLAVSSLEILDADFDGNQDVFVSGQFAPDSLYSGVLLNERDFILKPAQGQDWSGISAAGDLDEDGIFDLAFAGIDEQGNTINRLLLSESGINSNALQHTTTQSVFVADFNSDGKTDFNYFGKIGIDTLNLIQVGLNDYDTIPATHLLMQQFGDVDRDGDLDVVQLTKPNSLHIEFIENQTEENEGPSVPSEGVGIPVFDRYFVYWRTSADDHTISHSLTYDVVLNPVQTSEFDFINERRLRTSHGKNLTQNFRLFNDLTSTPSSFAIQSVDNAYTAFLGGNGICMGPTMVTCPAIVKEVMQVCRNEQVTLTATSDVLWFSFSDGFLGTMSSLSFKTEVADTVFSFDPAVLGCQSLKTWLIEIRNTPSIEFFEKYACEQQTIQLGVEPNWETVSWSSQLQGNLGSSDNINYTVTGADSVFVHLTNSEGCEVLRKTAIHISKPEVKVNEEQVVILKGQEAKLLASGAERYEWSPITNLSSAIIPNPIASPIVTTTYTVTGYDSINCSAHATVKVFVEDTGFVPNLFTPNEDGKNDELKIYGLNASAALNFSIYNRDGKLVYQTQNAAEAIQHGWDGTKNGAKQPAGVYFWKVSGKLGSGEPILLNGKKEGSIVLVR